MNEPWLYLQRSKRQDVTISRHAHNYDNDRLAARAIAGSQADTYERCLLSFVLGSTLEADLQHGHTEYIRPFIDRCAISAE